MRDTERVDHGDAIKRHARRVRSLADALTERAEPMTIAAFGNIDDATTAIEHHADALAADVAKLRAYARELEEIAEYAQRDNYMIDDVADLRAEHGVADIMRDDDTPPPGASGDGD